MNKRLRKKKHVGEFRELGCNVEYRYAPIPDDKLVEMLDIEVDVFLDFCNAHDLTCGGGWDGRRGTAGFFVTKLLEAKRPGPSGRPHYLSASMTPGDRAIIEDHFRSREASGQVHSFVVGPLIDVWYDKSHEINACPPPADTHPE